jgi:uncharacterized membrane protein YcaP (DUF421 family)
VDWRQIFVPNVPIAEIILRGTIMYLSLFVMLRVILKRETGAVSVTDLLVLVLIADASQNAMAGNYTTIPDGLVLVATILVWSYILDWLGAHFPFFYRLLRPPPLLLIEHGRMLRKNMRKELITEEELKSELRMAGIEDIQNVKRAYIEPDGEFSIIREDEEQPERPKKRNKGAG